MELRQLEYFVAVAETGSFTLAAQRLGVGQPAASTAIRRLEDTLGVELFTRTQQGVTLTVAGETLLPAARRTLLAATDARELIAAVNGGERDTIRFGNTQVTYGLRVGELLSQFRLRRPLISAELLNGGIGAAKLIEHVRDSRLDCAISASVRKAPPGVRFETLYSTEYGIHVAVDHPRLRGPYVTPQELAREPLVGSPAGTPERADLDHLLELLGIAPPIPLETNSFPATFDLVRDGQAVALLPRGLIWMHPPGVRMLPLDRELPRCRTVAVTPTNRPLRPIVGELMEQLTGAWTTAIAGVNDPPAIPKA
ncbi:LysR family transcriptional regulator [Conexibacter stalactiti]|uniref:LysR family transcriptional regulator n=1 Tax=Conexibacter stalactiti TaxID=1940611 RepID=A0ABU4HWM0_9ACTN|nr:LysR family transcriptional regulator [Conexibacter stalactiti]MDW5597564.1 LysR family transcriptional regulator [Conexibacter stalactiti]MEC5038206.1 LysR family transcriptional regulator [Conexibacter stalactiti]